MLRYKVAVACAALLVGGLGAATHASCQVDATAGQPDPARIAAARILVQTMGSEQQMRAQQVKALADIGASFDRLLPAQLVMRIQLSDPQGYAKVRDQAIKIMTEDRQQVMEATIPLLVDAEVRRYAVNFSVTDLKALTDFYRTPLGQRVIAEQPKMAADSAQFQQNVLAPMLTAHNAAVGQKLTPVLAPLVRQASAPTPAAGK